MNSSGDDPKRKPRSGSPAWLSSLSFSVILPLGIIWIANGTDSFCSNVWVPLPFIGYFRWDCAVLGFCLGELPVFWLCSKGNRIAWLLAILLMTLPFWPRQPVFYTLSPSTFLQLLHENGVSPFGKSIQILDSGLSNKDADRFLEIAWKHKTNWTHASAAKALGYYQFGKSENIDRKSTARPPFWSLQLGFLPSHTTLARESIYRQHFPEQQDHVQDIIRREMLPTLRGIYAQALNTTNVIFGEELDPKLGLPSIAIIAPNAMWSWIVNVHTDK